LSVEAEIVEKNDGKRRTSPLAVRTLLLGSGGVQSELAPALSISNLTPEIVRPWTAWMFVA
jgi:hypothetical protein